MHGKGVEDVIGAMVKRTASVKSNQCEIESAADFASALQDLQIFVTICKKTIKKNIEEMNLNSVQLKKHFFRFYITELMF